jgi:NAD+ synthase (glutamine-hydrolysing)
MIFFIDLLFIYYYYLLLLLGQTDEDEMGFGYDFIELYTTWLDYSAADREAFMNRLDAKSKAYFLEKGKVARAIHERNAHKASWPLNL